MIRWCFQGINDSSDLKQVLSYSSYIREYSFIPLRHHTDLALGDTKEGMSHRSEKHQEMRRSQNRGPDKRISKVLDYVRNRLVYMLDN